MLRHLTRLPSRESSFFFAKTPFRFTAVPMLQVFLHDFSFRLWIMLSRVVTSETIVRWHEQYNTPICANLLLFILLCVVLFIILYS